MLNINILTKIIWNMKLKYLKKITNNIIIVKMDNKNIFSNICLTIFSKR